MRKLILITLFPGCIFALTSCNTSYQARSVQYKDYHISSSQPNDAGIQAVLKPYSDSVNKSMNDVVGVAGKTLVKKSPEGSLGNFMVDAVFVMAKEKFNTPVDVAFMNYGGIRLPELPAGNVTRGKIFELMPFDNVLILQKMKGSVLQQLLDLIAARGGWPVAGMTMQIKDKKAVNVMIGNRLLDAETIYTTANSDFVANGGDNAEMLRPLPQINRGYLMRDALFDYIAKLNSQGKNITAHEENRVSHAQ